MSELQQITLPFFELKQNALLGHLLINEKFFNLVHTKVKPEWFLGAKNSQIYKLLLKTKERYGRYPKVLELKNSTDFQSMEPKDRRLLSAFIDVCIHATAQIRLETIKPELTEWLHSVILMGALKDAEKHYNKKDIKECHTRLMGAVREVADSTFDTANSITFSNYEEFLNQASQERKEALTTGLDLLDEAILKDSKGHSLQKGDTTLILAPVNSGKCLGKDTPVIMYDGSIKKIQDIRTGEFVMGPDEKPRKVLGTTHGIGPLYRIVPKSGGEAWVCNDRHVLSLKKGWNTKNRQILSNGEVKNYLPERNQKGYIVNIPVTEYLGKSKYWKSEYKLWHSKLDFSEKELPVDPYIFGLWLGDGHSSRASLTTMDLEIAKAWNSWVESAGCEVAIYSKKDNRSSTYAAVCKEEDSINKCNTILKKMGVKNNKHIPQNYLNSSREQRLKLLAGIIDTDGYYQKSGRSYEVVTKSDTLAQNYAFIARSLGFKVTMNHKLRTIKNIGFSGKYWSINIRGKNSEIPTRLARKKGEDTSKSSDISGFTVESIGEGEFFGFELDGDHLFMLGDFTVTHNSTDLITTMCHNIRAGKDALYMTHEGRPEDLRLKIMANMLDCTIPQVFKMFQTPEGKSRIQNATSIIDKHVKYIPYNKAGMTVEQVLPVIRNAQEQWQSDHDGKGFDLLVDDYPQILGTELARKGNLQKRNSDQLVYSCFVQLGLEYNWHNLLAIQTNREGSRINRGQGEDRLLTSEDVLESWGPITEATNVITLNRSPEDIKNGVLKYYIVKSRSSETGTVIVARTNFAKATTHSNALGATSYQGTRHNEDKVKELLAQFQNNDDDGILE